MSEVDSTDRMRQLIGYAAEAFDDQQSPFNTEWLVEHQVTSDECFALSASIATALRLFTYVTKYAHKTEVQGVPGLKRPTPEMQVLTNYLLQSLKGNPES